MYLSVGIKQRKGKERADKEIFNNVKLTHSLLFIHTDTRTPTTHTHTGNLGLATGRKGTVYAAL